MLRVYGPGLAGETIDSSREKIPDSATWIDLDEPSDEEERLVEQCVGVEVPTPEELAEIEPSSRFYEMNGAIYMTISTLCGVVEGKPSAAPIGFVLSGERLVTVRYVSPKPWRSFTAHVQREPELAKDSVTVLLRLLDAVVDRLADELEAAGEEIEKISNHVFRGDNPVRRRIPAERLEALLIRIGKAQGLLSRIRETAVSASRAVAFLGSTQRMRSAEADRERVQSLTADLASLIDHSAFLANNLTFLLDASLGLISIEQNATIKIFSVAAVIFLPPTLVGTVYGMNFDHMPELSWSHGYAFALALMAVSAILPYWFFRRRGWL